MAGNGGGIGRFARKKQLSQQENAPANAASGGGGGGQPNNNDSNSAVAAANDSTPANETMDPAATDGERPATAFNSFGGDDRPATSGSLGFTSIGTMFAVADDGMGDGVGGDFFSATPTDAMDNGEMMGGGHFGNFGGDDGGFTDFGGFDNGDEQPGMENNGDETKGGDATKPPAAAAPTNAAANKGIGGGGAGGIGLFAKKRATAASNTNAPAPAHTTAAAAPSAQNEPTTNNASNSPKINNDGMEANSVANLSRFDTDLMSKNTEVAVGTNFGVAGGGEMMEVDQGASKTDNNAGEEVPKTIPTSGDDVDDDLTEATCTTFAMAAMDVDGGAEAPREQSKEQEPTVASKASPYFTNPSAGNLADKQAAIAGTEATKLSSTVDNVMTQPTSNVHNNNDGSPPREEIVIPGITNDIVVNEPSPKTSGAGQNFAKPAEPVDSSPKQVSAAQRVSLSPRPPGMSTTVANMNTGATMQNMTAAQLGMKHGSDEAATANGGVGTKTLSPRQVSTQRVSLSPKPVGNVAKFQAAASTSPKGFTSTNDDQNGIVIPGAKSVVQTAGNILPAKSNATGSRTIGSGLRPNVNRQKPSSFMLKRNKAPSVSMNKPGAIGKSSGPIGTNGNSEKVTFALPAARPSANRVTTNTAPMGGNTFEKNSASTTNSNTPSSTAITPDHRRYDGSTQAKATGTPFAHGANQNSTVSPTPQKEPAPAPAPAATDMQLDSSPYDRVVPGMPPMTANDGPVELQAEKPTEAPIQSQRRPRSETIYSPPPPSKSPESTITPKASNVNNGMVSTFHTDESFDQLLEQFVQDIQTGTDIYEKSQNDLLELEVDLSHAFNGCLQYQEHYIDLLDEIETIHEMTLNIMEEVAAE